MLTPDQVIPMKKPVRVFSVAAATLCLGAGTASAQMLETELEPAIRERITFSNGSNVLAGHLLKPAGPGPYPAFVALMGSGDESYRQSWAPRSFPFWKDIAGALVDRGYAVLLFDKPGGGVHG